ncbi:uncharacterized protein LOC115627420 [Scaptodrosophila lebanonensis]|uniref:Uncharacterized protein LOC115627420 n=1 Tax=Drosophila lebanonensis TaxID=7225 RepID=A0A6J2TTP7_DROLE|nr:uncharacterized protein LOC115627420 [Scaptodrosophila lebanonensis]
MDSRFKTMIIWLALLHTTLAMTNDQLLSLESVDQSPAGSEQLPFESPHIAKIAPKTAAEEEEAGGGEGERVVDIQTFVQELRSAGVQTAERRDLETLGYRELTRLLGLLHLTQERSYYTAGERSRAAKADKAEQ